jgi:hypothetical protein
MSTAIADRLEITELFGRLDRLLDERRWADIGTVYDRDVEVHSPRTQARGLDQVLDFVRGNEVAAGEHTQHTTTGVVVDLAGDRATATANSYVHYYRDGEPPHQVSGLRITFTTIRTPEGWRVRESRIALAWSRGA